MKTLSVVVTILFTARLALGCSCGSIPPPLKALAQADATFFGKAIETEEKDIPYDSDGRKTFLRRLAVTFSIQKTFKGDPKTQSVIVLTGLGGGDCGFPFEKGKSYLVYAYKPQDTLATDICTRTHETTIDSKEVLELENRLPPFQGEEKPPTLSLKGHINDAGYTGYVFTLENKLKNRIFFLSQNNWIFVAQKLIDGKWVDSVPNFDVVPAKGDDSESIQRENIASWKKGYDEIPTEHSYSYLDISTSMPFFVASQSSKYPWRIGIQYVTEDEFDRGNQIQQSKSIVWSDPISLDQKATSLSFKQAFDQQKE